MPSLKTSSTSSCLSIFGGSCWKLTTSTTILLLQRFFQPPPSLWGVCVCVCGGGGGCFNTNLDKVINSIVFILQVALKFSVQGIDSIIKQTMKFFIWLQLIMYEFIHFLTGISSFKDSLLFLSQGRNRKDRGKEV